MADFFSNLLAPLTGEPIEEAAAAKEAAIREGQRQLEASYASGRGALTNQYTQALQPYLALQQPATGGYQAYADASGAAGLPGQIRAQEAFKTDPGYLFAQKQMEDAVQRSGAAGGIAIGNRTADIMDRTQGLAARSYGDYVQRLLPWLGQGLGVAGGLGNIYTGLGGELNRSFTGMGNAQLGAQTAIGDAQAQGLMAPMIAGGNIWSGIGQAAKLAAGAATGGMSTLAGAAGSGLFNAATGGGLGGFSPSGAGSKGVMLPPDSPVWSY